MLLLESNELADRLTGSGFLRSDQGQPSGVVDHTLLVFVVGTPDGVADGDGHSLNHGQEGDYRPPDPLTGFPQRGRGHQNQRVLRAGHP